MMISKHYKKSLGSSDKNFVNFVKINTTDVSDDSINETEFLAKRVAQNMYLYPENVATAKSDYILLVALLIRKGVLFREYRDLEPDPANYD